MRLIDHFIAGGTGGVAPARKSPVFDPNTGDIQAEVALGDAAMLDRAARLLAPGGRLVYAVCSLEPEEGEAQIAAFLSRHGDFKLAPAAPGEGGAPEASLLADGTLRLLPHHRPGGQDGFYVARLRREV